MGLLTVGVPLTWEATKGYARYIRDEGIKQFLLLYHKLNSRMKHTLKWGDEIEYTLVHFDPLTQEAKLFLGASDVMKQMQSEELNHIWQPEYAEYMVEGLPIEPFGRILDAFNTVEPNMSERRQELAEHLPPNCYALSISAFPRLGCPDFTFPHSEANPKSSCSRSLFFPDAAITQSHPRFKTLTRNIRERRGSKVAINVPIFHDSRTPKPFIEDLFMYHDGTDPTASSAALPDHVYLDAMGFGMGCCCFQITFQSCCIIEARILYDQLTTICPIILALSAATPAIRGFLLDTDCRWGIISAAVDDRTDEERGLKPLKENSYVIPKSRYDSVSSYLSPMGETYNDVPLVYDETYYQKMRKEGVDHLLARHVAHLFIRDPISVFEERLIPPPDEEFVDHFENIQSTNWQSMRFKPPPLNSSIGWRVEFRPTELQLTDFENAAFATFIILLSRTILKLNLNLLIPLSKVEENMKTAIKRDAARTGQFYFRRTNLLTTDGSPVELTKVCATFRRRRTYSTHIDGAELNISNSDERTCPLANPENTNIDPDQCYTAMSVNEIMNGNDTFPGLIPLVRHYVHMTGGDCKTLCKVYRYLDFLERRASGELLTTAAWMRKRIMSHPDYHADSYVSSVNNGDLMRECIGITQGKVRPPDLLPPKDVTLPATLNTCPSGCELSSVLIC